MNSQNQSQISRLELDLTNIVIFLNLANGKKDWTTDKARENFNLNQQEYYRLTGHYWSFRLQELDAHRKYREDRARWELEH